MASIHDTVSTQMLVLKNPLLALERLLSLLARPLPLVEFKRI